MADLDQAIMLADVARGFAGMSRGKARSTFMRAAKRREADVIAIADAQYGAPSADIAAMSDDELLSELTATEATE